jgi:hypothetical protein
VFVALNLPAIGGMRFTNVDDEKCDLLTKAAGQGFELPSLGTKGRSGVAAKNQRHRLVIVKR